MRLSPDELIFWRHGFLKLNATIAYHMGIDDPADRRLEARHAHAFLGVGAYALAEPSGNHRHRP